MGLKKFLGLEVDAPPKRKYGKETRQTFEDQLGLIGDLYKAEQEYRPQFAALDYGIMRDLFGGGEFYEQDLLPGLQRSQEAASDIALEGDIGRLEGMGTRGLDAVLAANPLLAQLYGSSMDSVGGGLPADYKREVQQDIRESQAARGMGYSPSDAAAEASLMGREREAYLARRRAEAQGVQREAMMPALEFLFGPSVSTPEATQVAGMTAGFNPGQIFNPESAYAGSLYASNQNQAMNQAITEANNRAALVNTLIKTAGSMKFGAPGS